MKLPLTIAILAAICAVAAAAGDPVRPAFEVADVQIHTDQTTQTNAQFLPGGRVDIANLNMKQLVLAAFNVGQGVSGKLVEGLPGWTDTVSYDIIAKANPTTPISTLRTMLQSLLEDRFKMTFHHEDRPMQVYVLTVGKGSPKLQPAAGTGGMNCGPGTGIDNMLHLACVNMSMADLVKSLPTFAPRYFDIPVTDATGITGKYDINLDWYPVGAGNPNGDHAPSDSPEIASTTIFDAVQHLGFKLEKRRQPYPIVVIDHIEKDPLGN